jgi:hypothetical protein
MEKRKTCLQNFNEEILLECGYLEDQEDWWCDNIKMDLSDMGCEDM